MPSLSQRPRRRPALDDHEDEPPRRRRRTPADEEDEEEEVKGEGGEDEEGEEDEEEEEEEQPRSRRQRQSQGQSQSQRRRPRNAGRRRQEEEESDGDDDADENGELPQTQANRQQLHQQLLAKKLVRYALACEPRRVPIRRQAVKEQVLDNEGKHFRTVFPIAQKQLRDIFGMELVEWPARDETTMSVRERRKALKTQKQQQPGGAQGTQRKGAAAPPVQRMDRFVLLSTLPDAYREVVFAPIPVETSTRNPPASDAAYVGFCTLVVSLITLGGGSMSHSDLEKYLGLLYGTSHHLVRADEDFMKPMAAMMGDHVDDDDGGAGGVGQTQDGDAMAPGSTMQHLVRQGYVVRVVEEGTAGGSSVHSGAKVTWHVGPRGRLEVGPAEVAAVVRHVYGQDADAEMEQQLESSLRSATNATNKGEKKSRGGRIEQEQQRQRDEDEEDAAVAD